MVKPLLALLLVFSFAFSFESDESEDYNSSFEQEEFDDNEYIEDNTTNIVVENVLTKKIKSFLDEATYENNIEFINVIFDPESSFYENERVNSVRVVQTLKDNGLLKLFFNEPKELQLNFKTSGSPLFFVKIMGDTLSSIGYYRYVTTASHLNSSEFLWSINLRSEYATDPLILETELNKNGCKIIDVERNSATEWTYIVDMTDGNLNIQELEAEKETRLKRSLYAHWLDVSKIKKLEIRSSRRNSWYPYLAYYDASLHLLKILKRDKIYNKIRLKMPPNAKYMKISDMYTLKNVRDELRLLPEGTK